MNHASFVEKYRSKSVQQYRGVTRLDGARGKKQVWYPHGRTWEIFRKQMYCIEGSTCDIVGNFRHPPQSFGAPIVIQRPANCSLLAPPSLRPCNSIIAKLRPTKEANQSFFVFVKLVVTCNDMKYRTVIMTTARHALFARK